MALAKDSVLGKEPRLGTRTLCEVCEMSQHGLIMGAKGMTGKALGFRASAASGFQKH